MGFIPEIPEDLRAARIGTCYNAFTRKLISTRNAIDPNKLEYGIVEFVSGSAELSVSANSSSAKNVKGGFFGLDAKAKLGPWATAAFGMSLAASESDASNSLNCFCSYVFKGQKLQLMKLEPDTLFNIMTDDFQKAYTELVTARGDEVQAKYHAFVKKFGYGCVTALHLCSGSAFEICAQHNDRAKSLEDKYNASAGIGCSQGGVSVAVDFAKNEAAADSSATVKITGVNIPESTPTREWCNQYVTSLAGIGFSKLAETAQTISAYSGDTPKAPDIPQGKKDGKDLPDDKMENIDEDMKKELMAEDGFEGDWNAYLKKQEELFKTIKPDAVVKEAGDNLEEHLARTLDELPTAKASAVLESASGWDLGGYVPHHVEWKPWSELFEALPHIQLPTGLGTLYVAKAYMYYMTRLQFISYMDLLIDIDNSNQIKHMRYRNACNTACQKLLMEIEAYQQDGVITEERYRNLLASFEQELQRNVPDFFEKSLYKLFFQYYDFFQKNCGGTILAGYDSAKKKCYYIGRSGNVQIESYHNLHVDDVLANAARAYPVLELDGFVFFCTYLNGGWRKPFECDMRVLQQKIDEHKQGYYSTKDDEIRVYSVNEKNLRATESIPLAAIPMLSPLDFDDIYNFLGIEV